MSEFVLKPKEQEIDPDVAKVPDVQFDNLEDELKGAIEADGADQVAKALEEVATGKARPEALLEWMDDLREAEEVAMEKDDNLERSFTVDFIPDTARDGGATESPPADEFMFSANRRVDDDFDDGGGGGGGGGGGDGGAGEGSGDDAEGDAEAEAADPKDDKKKAAATKAAKKPEAKPPTRPEPPPAAKPGKPGKGDDKK